MGETSERSSRRFTWVAVLGVVTLVIVAAWVGYRSGQSDTDEPADPGPPRAELAPLGSGTEEAESVVVDGPGITEPGVVLRALVDAEGVDIAERMLLDGSVTELVLTPPRPPARFGPGRKPSVSGLQIAADGVLVPVPVPGDFANPIFVELPQGAKQVELRYQLKNAIRRSQPAPPGRATVLLRPLGQQTLGSLPTVTEVGGSVILNVQCPQMPASGQLCGYPEKSVWRTKPVPAARSTAVVLTDLQAPLAGSPAATAPAQ